PEHGADDQPPWPRPEPRVHEIAEADEERHREGGLEAEREVGPGLHHVAVPRREPVVPLRTRRDFARRRRRLPPVGLLPGVALPGVVVPGVGRRVVRRRVVRGRGGHGPPCTAAVSGLPPRRRVGRPSPASPGASRPARAGRPSGRGRRAPPVPPPVPPMSQRPVNVAPSSMTSLPVRMSPSTTAVALRTSRSFTATWPWTRPPISAVVEFTSPSTRPSGITTVRPCTSMFPLTVPLTWTLPLERRVPSMTVSFPMM